MSSLATKPSSSSWPLITPPTQEQYLSFSPLTGDKDIPNFVMNCSLYALNYLCTLRDDILSQEEQKWGRWKKLTGVVALSTISLAHPVLNTAEAATRISLGVVCLPALMACTTPLRKNSVVKWTALLSAGLISTGVYSLTTTFTGPVAIREMLTNPENMPDVKEMANKASCGFVNKVESFITKLKKD